MPQMKYEKHNARQYEQILRAARQLFVEKGIERVSFSAWRTAAVSRARRFTNISPIRNLCCGPSTAKRCVHLETHCWRGGGASAHGPGTLFRVF